MAKKRKIIRAVPILAAMFLLPVCVILSFPKETYDSSQMPLVNQDLMQEFGSETEETIKKEENEAIVRTPAPDIRLIDDSPKEARLTEISSGRLYFPNGWNIGLKSGETYEETTAITDAPDLAAITHWDGKIYITDHASQGFEVIKDYGVGSTAEIHDDREIIFSIECIAIYSDCSWNDGWTYLPDGRSAWNGPGQVIMQTCNNAAGDSVTVSYWNTKG